MGAYDIYPKGAYLLGTHTVSAPSVLKKRGFKFVVGYMGAGLARGAKFTDVIQVAADADLPFVAYFENDPEAFVAQYQSLNLTHWLISPESNDLIKNVIGPSVLSGGVKRRIHMIVVGMNKLVETSGKVLPDNWVIDTARFLKIAIEKLYGIPVVFYIDPAQALKLPHGPSDNFTTFLAAKDGQGNFILPGISTFLNAFPGGEEVVAGEVPAPPDTFAPILRQMKIDSGLGNAKGLEFLCYSVGRVKVDGITGNFVPLWLYFGTTAGLYERLKFAPLFPDPDPDTDPDPGPDTDPDPDPDTEPDPDTDPDPGPVAGWRGVLEGALVAALDAFCQAWLTGRGKGG